MGAGEAVSAQAPATPERVSRGKQWAFKPSRVLDVLVLGLFTAELGVLAWSLFLANIEDRPLKQKGQTFWGENGPMRMGAALLAVAGGIYASQAIAEKIGRYLSDGPLRSAPFHRPLNSAGYMSKWKSQAWQLVVHSIMAALGQRALAGQPWYDNPHTCFDPIPQMLTPSDDVRIVYIVQISIWIITLLCHVFLFEKQKDYYVMAAHHVVTIALILISNITGCHPLGTLVLYIHDISDVFIDVLKMTVYAKLEEGPGLFAVEISYVSAVCAWFYYRLYKYPQMVYEGAYRHACMYSGCHPLDGAETGGVQNGMVEWKRNFSPETYHSYWYAGWLSVLLLSILFVMHIYWIGLILNILVLKLTESDKSMHDAGKDAYDGDDASNAAHED